MDFSSGPSGFDSVLDGVFDQGLQDEGWHKGIEEIWFDRGAKVKSVLKSGFFNREIVIEKFDLLSK